MDTLLQKHSNPLRKKSFISNQLSSYSNRQLDFPCGFSDVVSNTTTFDAVQGEDGPVEVDYFDGVLRYINQMLNEEEEELDDRHFMFHDCLALQAAEQSFYDVLNQENPPPLSSSSSSGIIVQESPGLVNNSIRGIHRNQNSFFMDSNKVTTSFFNQVRSKNLLSNFSQNTNQICYASTSSNAPVYGSIDLPQADKQLADCNNHIYVNECGVLQENSTAAAISRNGNSNESRENTKPSEIFTREKNSHQRDEREEENNGENSEGRSSKQFAGCDDESDEEKEKETYDYDKALLCPNMNPNFYKENPSKDGISGNEADQWKDYSRSTKRGRPKLTDKKSSIKKEVVDLRGLLTRCAQAVTISDGKTACEILKQIREHSSAYGDAPERLAHYFADALEARINSTGAALYSASATRQVSSLSIVKAYQAYVLACPFRRMSNIFANKSIGRQVGQASSIHIIDFGISYGFQWPCIIHGLSLKPGGPPRLKITGIDFPQQGLRPAERIKKTGERLASFCQRFGVPFEFNAVAKRWDLITIEDLKIDTDEKVVVNCLYRLRHVADESLTTEDSPRDRVLELIEKINPDLFVHGVLNATYNAPFFGTRFREALFHFSSLFDMFETTVPQEDQDRLLYEREFFGREIMNIVACEGSERVERPETYKQWQGRIQRAGFRQLPINKRIVKEVIAKVGWSYHRDFLVDEDSNWLLQGWKGRVIYALSCWMPINK